ncbi:hypothetical protein NDU88_002039 [Pleurodeles waltl]|uniref:Uncharacterized protein n=1 Tax=Pleurodeles waltl TaxID=8319 RepID=A0AAV7RDC4_PLEWA|nr:hypothetical protein NDU88_002039 [Pleurodeles waltl]
MQTTDCSTKLMGTLITQAKRRMEEQITKIEQLTKELEKMPNQQEISIQLAKMEERIKHKEDEIKSQLQIGDLNKLRDIVKLYVKWLNGEKCGNKQQPSCLTTRKPAVDPWGFKYKLPQTSYIN